MVDLPPWPFEWCEGNHLYNVQVDEARGCEKGKSLFNIAMAKIHMRLGKKVVFATSNQKNLIVDLRRHFPTALFEIIDDWGVSVFIVNKKELS
jgi:hypothetical protein